VTPASIGKLFESQQAAWPDLKSGVEGLAHAVSREFVVDSVRVVALHIPHRIKSTTAPVDPEAVRKRPCFLCSRNRPPEQEGIPFGNDLVVLCNPFPILDQHVTIVYPDHTPQKIVGTIRSGFLDMLDAAAALPGFMVLYNGAKAGASAPDHLHFQAGSHAGVPVIEDVLGTRDGVIPDYLRSVFVLAGDDAARIERRFEGLMAMLAGYTSEIEEAMVNIIVVHDGGHWTVLVFPRARHRPAVYHQGILTWSPGAIDMAGIVVLPVASDLERIRADDIRSVFGEVSLSSDAVIEIASKLDLK
jgi:hypothetical protein